MIRFMYLYILSNFSRRLSIWFFFLVFIDQSIANWFFEMISVDKLKDIVLLALSSLWKRFNFNSEAHKKNACTFGDRNEELAQNQIVHASLLINIMFMNNESTLHSIHFDFMLTRRTHSFLNSALLCSRLFTENRWYLLYKVEQTVYLMFVSSISRYINYSTYNQIYSILCACINQKLIALWYKNANTLTNSISIRNVTMFRKRLIWDSIHDHSRITLKQSQEQRKKYTTV